MRKSPWLYSMGSLAAALASAVVSTYVYFFYVDHLKLPAVLIGTGMGIYGIWNAINDPLLGYISDRTRTSMGRRIPYIRYGMLPLALILFLIWLPTSEWFGGSTTALFVYFMIVLFFFDGLYTMVILNWTALFPEMYQDGRQRTQVSAARQILGIVGNILGIAAPPLLYTSIGWPAMGLGFAAITLGSLALSLAASKENPVYSEAQSLNIKEALKSTFGNFSFLMYVLGALLVQFTFVLLQGAMPFYTKYVLKIGEGLESSLVLGAVFISAAFLVYVWSFAANRIGSRQAMLLAVAIYGIFLIPFWFADDLTSGIIASVLLGIGLAGILVLMDVLLADTVDEDELKTGVRREGMYFGVNALLIRLGVSLQGLITGFVLDSTGYVADAPQQSARAVTGIRLLISAIPLASIIVALVFFYFYPLHGKRLKNVKSALAQKPYNNPPGH